MNYEKYDNKTPVLKILALGNSFSVDAMEYLYQIAQAMGKKVLLGNLYIGGCTLNHHWNCIMNNTAEYHYSKNINGIWEEHFEITTARYGLMDEAWDVITMQQASGSSGKSESYNEDLEKIIQYVQENRRCITGKLGWQMTWAYQQDSTHNEFLNYQQDQNTMYQSICRTVQEKILTNPQFDFIIPTGTAIQNMRTSPIGDHLTRDGFHLSYQLGRYIAGLTWYCAITKDSIADISWVPDKEEIPENLLYYAKRSVQNAIHTPYQVTRF